MHPLNYLASIANEAVLYYYQAMRAEDSNLFQKAISEEIESLKEENIFTLLPLELKLKDKSPISLA